MRIIGGKYRGRILTEFEGKEVRPTADRVKESLFNILFLKISGARVLDLFAGSGALGMECLSRGANEVVFNDVKKESVALLQKNLIKLGAEKEKIKVYTLDYALCLSLQKEPFDLIFIDPPYAEEAGLNALQRIGRDKLVKEDGIVVYERDRSFVDKIEGLVSYDERSYGKTYLTFFKRTKENG